MMAELTCEKGHTFNKVSFLGPYSCPICSQEAATVQRDAGWWNCVKHIETPRMEYHEGETIPKAEPDMGEFVPGALDGMETWPDGIDYIRRVRLEPGDVLVLFSERSLTAREQERIREQVQAAFPNNGLLILHGALRLGVLGPGE